MTITPIRKRDAVQRVTPVSPAHGAVVDQATWGPAAVVELSDEALTILKARAALRTEPVLRRERMARARANVYTMPKELQARLVADALLSDH